MNTILRTFFRTFWLLGITALVVSAAGAGYTIYSRTGTLPGGDASPKPTAPPSAERVTAALIGYVDIEKGVRLLYPVVPGRVVQVPVDEDQLVKKGDILLSLDRTQAEILVRQATLAVSASEDICEKARKLPAQQELKEKQLRAAIAAYDHKLKAGEFGLKRMEVLRAANTGGDVAGNEIAAVREQLEELKSLRQIEELKLLELGLNDPKYDIRQAERQLSSDQGKLDHASKVLTECDVRAPEDGMVLRLLVGPGDVITSQSKPPITFAPSKPIIIRAELDQEYANRVQKGQLAIVEDDSRSGEAWKGVVQRIARSYQQRRSNALDPFSLSDTRILECIVQLEPAAQMPRLGQRVRVKVLEQASR